MDGAGDNHSVCGNQDPERQTSYAFLHLWISTLNLHICMFHLEYTQSSGN